MVWPQMIWVASGTIGIPVTLLIYGTVREERGFTSMMYTSSPFYDKLDIDHSLYMKGP